MELEANKKKVFLKVLIGSLIVIFIVLLIIFVFNKNKRNDNIINESKNIVKVNTNESINEVKTLKGLTFENTNIVYDGVISILTTKITNNGSVNYEKEKFKIIIKDKDNKVICTFNGLITGGLKPNEIRNINSSIDIDLSSNAYYVEYEEVE